MPYPIPTDHERRALFAWLKQASSLTAWRRLYTFHQVFLDAITTAYKDEQNTPGVKETIPTDWYTDVLRSQDAFAGALDRLVLGDRRCFTFLGARGHFSEGIRNVQWWQDMYAGSYSGRNGFAPEASPHWPAIENAMHDCLAAFTDIGVVLQDRVTGNPAVIVEVKRFLANPNSSLVKHLINQTALPPVPIARPQVLVQTGQVIPCHGVWEPVRHTVRSGTQRTADGRTFDLPDSWEVEGLTVDGCLNYLQGDFDAPTIAFKEDTPRRDGRPTTWRLVWRDDRYGDEPIPEEESRYVFVRPVAGEVLFTYG